MVPGTEPTTSGIRMLQSRPWMVMFDRGGEHEGDRLDQVGADQLHRRESGVEHQQGDHDHRPRTDAGDADEQAAERTHQERDEGADVRVGGRFLSAGHPHPEADVQSQRVGAGRHQQGEADAQLEHVVELVGAVGDGIDQIGPEQGHGHRAEDEPLGQREVG
jgi:hypothetical protein